jgi:hypothetical protein
MVPGVTHFLETQIRGRKARAVLGAIGLLGAYNLLAAWIGGLTGGWAIYAVGWPIELLVLSLGLCLIVYATSSIWPMIPAGILLGNGLLFSYTSVTGNWRHWAFLWPLELLLIGGTIWFPIWAAKRGDYSRRLSGPLGCSLGVVAIVWSVLVVLASVVIEIVR